MVDSVNRLKLFHQLGRTYRAFLTAYEKEVGHFLPRWAVMLYLYTEEPLCSQKRLGDALLMDHGALSRQLSALESLGWIIRVTDQHDKRITNVSLTDQGKQEVERGLPKRAAFIKSTLSGIPDQQLCQVMDVLSLLETRFGAISKQQTATESAMI